MDLRDKLRKAAGLFVELPPVDETPEAPREMSEASVSEPPRRTVEDIVRKADGPDLADIQMTSPPPPAPSGGAIDFDAVYQSAGLQPASFTAEQMIDMLKSLPADLPLASKRQMLQVTLTAMGKSIGVSPETIVTDASRKMAALTAYSESLAAQTKDAVASAQREIAQLEAQIEDRKQRVAAAQAGLADVTKTCAAKSDELDDVLEFFSLDIPPSKHAT